MHPVLPVKRATDTAILPTRAFEDDAGLDFYCDERAFTLQPGERKLTSTGVAIQLPTGTAGFVHPRSGLGHEHGLTVVNSPGTIDVGYRGIVKINLINLGQEPVTINHGERIGQLIVQEVLLPKVVEVDELDDTPRGATGHGSTGK